MKSEGETTENGVTFKNLSSDFELIDRLRIRWQMFVRNIEGLHGFLCGYSLRQDNFQDELWGFIEFLAELKGEKPNISTWTKLISQEAEEEAYEIPIFFDYLDRYRGFDYQILGEAELTRAQRAFALERQLRVMNVDYIECPLKPPHTLRAIVLPNGDLHVFGYDKKGKKYDEHPRMKDFSYVKTWAKTCFDINETAWHRVPRNNSSRRLD